MTDIRGMLMDQAGAGQGRTGPTPAAYAVTAVLLGSAFVGLLWVPSYAHLTPSIGGLPFFYWYSLAWLVANAVCQVIAYQLMVAAPRRRRRRAGGPGILPAGGPGAGPSAGVGA